MYVYKWLNNRFKQGAFVTAILLFASSTTFAAKMPTQEEMWEMIQQQQRMIVVLQEKLEKTDERITETDEKLEITTDAIESGDVGNSSVSWASRTTVGGYGELHYNNLEKGDGTEVTDSVDLHRFVLYFGHEFNDRMRFFSEFELEHSIAGEGQVGEVEVEQAWLEFDVNESHRIRAGVDIVPVGIINMTHEPNTFFGVERNNVEKNIIPATWWEAGIGMNGEIYPGWNYDVVLHSGLSIKTGKYKIRDGRKKVGKAPADAPAMTGRLRYTGIPGLEVGVTAQYQSDVTQNGGTTGGGSASLIEAHVDYRHSSGLGLRALAAQWDIDDEIDNVSGSDQQHGYYIEPSYRFRLTGLLPGELGVFARYSFWDNEAGNSIDTEFKQFDAGLNYWPTENVVFKFDYQEQQHDAGSNEQDGFNLGLGYQF